MTNLMISKHFQHFLIIDHKSFIHEYSIIEFQYYTLSGTQNGWNPSSHFHFFTQASLHIWDDGTINYISDTGILDKISNLLQLEK